MASVGLTCVGYRSETQVESLNSSVTSLHDDELQKNPTQVMTCVKLQVDSAT